VFVKRVRERMDEEMVVGEWEERVLVAWVRID
jgi:hypothetical protein